MKIMFINNDGGGFADYIEVEEGTEINKLFNDRMPGESPHDFNISVNRQPVPKSYVLQEGDRVSITPTKVAAGRRCLALHHG